MEETREGWPRANGGVASGGEDDEDHFDSLPDAVLLDVFNHIGDVKALGRCALVSRRFHALVPLVDSVLVRVDCVIPDDPPPSASSSPPPSPTRGRGALAHIRSEGVLISISSHREQQPDLWIEPDMFSYFAL